MGVGRGDLVALYRRYLPLCNERRFEELRDLVSDEVSGSGSVDGASAYIDRVRDVFTAFPDYGWELQHLVVEGETVAARLIGQGTHTGSFGDIDTQELVMYRFADGRIVGCWGDLYPVVRDALTVTYAATS